MSRQYRSLKTLEFPRKLGLVHEKKELAAAAGYLRAYVRQHAKPLNKG